MILHNFRIKLPRRIGKLGRWRHAATYAGIEARKDLATFRKHPRKYKTWKDVQMMSKPHYEKD